MRSPSKRWRIPTRARSNSANFLTHDALCIPAACRCRGAGGFLAACRADWHLVCRGQRRDRRRRIGQLIQVIGEHNAAWEAWFASSGVRPHRVSYEELDVGMAGVTRGILDFLGLDVPDDRVARPPPRTRNCWCCGTRSPCCASRGTVASVVTGGTVMSLRGWSRSGMVEVVEPGRGRLRRHRRSHRDRAPGGRPAGSSLPCLTR